MSGPALYDILPTPYGGRGAFAREPIPKGTLILTCSAPYAHVIYWQFRREVCAWCFAYSFESGKSKWGVKLSDNERACGNGGVWFCSEPCRDLYIKENEIFEGGGAEWRTVINILVEKMLTQNAKRNGATPPPALSYLETLGPTTCMTPELVDAAWAAGRDASDTRRGWTEELTEFEIDTARYALDGLLSKIVEETNPRVAALDRLPERGEGYCVSAGRWADYMELQDNELALMRTSPQMLGSHVRVYRFLRHLAAMLPPSPDDDTYTHVVEQLRKNLASPDVTRALLGRDAGNVFGLWDMATDEGSEMLGWGAFIFASYFNHNCEANIKKKRNKRGVEFYTLKDIAAGEEICISYADGDSVHERLNILQKGWFFACQCAKCARELELAAAAS